MNKTKHILAIIALSLSGSVFANDCNKTEFKESVDRSVVNVNKYHEQWLKGQDATGQDDAIARKLLTRTYDIRNHLGVLLKKIDRERKYCGDSFVKEAEGVLADLLIKNEEPLEQLQSVLEVQHITKKAELFPNK